MLEHALAYVQRGFAVFPLHTPSPATGYCSCGKLLGRKKKDHCEAKHPRTPNGFRQASKDENQIREWWKQWPNANIGIATGVVSGFFVIDLDEKPEEGLSGSEGWAKLVTENGPDGNPPEIESGSGGIHLLYRHVEGVGNSNKAMPKGIDIRGEGGYIVAPPSVHFKGGRYTWINDAPLVEAPGWLVERLKSRVLFTPRDLVPEALGDARTVSEEDIRDFLSKQSHPDHVQVARAVLDGTSWGPSRHNKMVAFLGALRMFIMNKYDGATVDPDTTALLFASCTAAATAEGVNSITDCDWVAGLIRDLSANDGEFRARLKATAQAETAKSEQFITELANNGATFKQSSYALTDAGNAERLIDTYGSLIRFVPAWNKWMIWDGKRWALSMDGGEVMQLALKSAREIMSSMPYIEDPEGAEDIVKAYQKWAMKSESVVGLAAAVRACSTDPRVRVDFEQLDTEEFLFNVQNGVLDLETGKLLPHSSSRRISKISPVAYNPEATCPAWESFLLDAMGGDVEMVEYLQRWVGYMLTGTVLEHAMMFNRGTGGNGKGTFFDQITAVWGDYAVVCESDLLFKTHGNKHSTGLTDLFRARLAITSEVEENRSWDEQLVKRLTGGDALKARRMHENNWTFSATHKLVVLGNSDPVVRGTDDGMWRRIHCIPFDVSFVGREDRNLKARLTAEREGILAWAVRGCLAWRQRGLVKPQRVVDATLTYRLEQDSLGQFLAERCVVDKTAKVTRSEFREAYEIWCKDNGERYPLGSKAIANKMKHIGVKNDMCKRTDRTYAERAWKGVRLVKTEADQRLSLN